MRFLKDNVNQVAVAASLSGALLVLVALLRIVPIYWAVLGQSMVGSSLVLIGLYGTEKRNQSQIVLGTLIIALALMRLIT